MNEKSWELYSQILAQENVKLEYSRYARTAYFDIQKRVVTIPMFEYMNDDVTQLLISHEVGHACYSTYSYDEYQQYMNKYHDLFNVVEDAHIENRLKINFSGLKNIFFNGYKILYRNDFFEVKENKLSQLTLTERLNLYYKIGHIIHVPFMGKENEFAIRLKSVISKEEVILLCEDILQYLKNNEYDNHSSESESNNENDEDGTTENNKQNDDESSNDNLEYDDKNIKKELTDKISSIFNEKLEDYGDEQIDNNDFPSNVSLTLTTKKYINKIINYTDYYTKIHKTTFVKSNFCYSWIRKIKNLAKSADIIFQQKKKALELKNIKNVRLGKLNLKKLSYYKISENIFTTRKIISEGKSHGIVILIDYSSSMDSYLKDTLIQACILGEFCKMNDIPFVILAFGVLLNKEFTKNNCSYDVAMLGNNDDFDIGSILYLSKNDNIIFKTGNTPTVEGLLAASYFIEQFKSCDVEKTSLYLITDGVYSNEVIIDNQLYNFSRDSKYITVDNILYNIDSVISKSKRIHTDWIIELLFLNMKLRFKTFISVSYIGDFNNVKNLLTENSQNLFFGKIYAKNMNSYSFGLYENYLYLWKHAYYFEDCKKIPNDLTNGILSYNFKNNPFLDRFQFFDYTDSHNKQSQSKNILTESSLYYKKLKIFVNGFIAEFS